MANAHRHAGATECRIRLTVVGLVDPALDLQIVDNGRGWDPATAGRGLGLRSMRERATELGGDFDVAVGPEGGVRIWARLPIGSAVDEQSAVVGLPVANGGSA